jgi:hypothetical protein
MAAEFRIADTFTASLAEALVEAPGMADRR